MRIVQKSALSALCLAALAMSSVAAETQMAPKQENTWVEISHDDNITTWKKDVPGSDLVAFKGESVIDAPIAKVANVLYDTPRKTEWVAHCVETKNIHLFSETDRIEYNHTESPWRLILKDRDFLFRAQVSLDKAKKELVIHMASVKDDAMPEQECCVRGVLNESTYTLTSIDGGKKTNLAVEIHADPKGGVAKWIVNLFQKSWPRTTLKNIQRQVAKPDVTELAALRKYFEEKPSDGMAPAKAAVQEQATDDVSAVQKL